MKKLITTLALGLALTAAPAFANHHEEGETAEHHAMSTSTTTIDVMMADEAALAVLNEHIPEIVNNPQIGMAAGMTFRDVQMYAPNELTDEKLDAIDNDLAHLAH